MKKNYFSNNPMPDNDNKSRYLVTYSDLITLLLGLFVILYASAQVDEGKYRAMSAAFAQVFNAQDSAKTSGKGILPGDRKIAVGNSAGNKVSSAKSLEEQAENILGSFIREKGVKVSLSGSSLVLTLPEMLLFKVGDAELSAGSNELLDSLASLLSKAKMLINVDGHTDSTPIHTFRYQSNWHLSTSRAINVAYSLISRGIAESDVVVRGFGSQRPVGDNSTAEGKQRNRRVEITVSEFPTDAPSTAGYSTKLQ